MDPPNQTLDSNDGRPRERRRDKLLGALKWRQARSRSPQINSSTSQTSHTELPAEVPPKSLTLNPAANLIQIPSQDLTVGFADPIDIDDIDHNKDLWKAAYEDLKRREPDLTSAYERYLESSSAGPHASNEAFALIPELLEAAIEKQLRDREIEQIVIQLGEKSIKVREQGERLIKIILWSSDYISAAVSAQPYAALAWSGLSIVLPLLLNASKHTKEMLEGLDLVADYMRRCKIRAEIYFDSARLSVRPDLIKAAVELYSTIFEYQVRAVYHLSRGSFKRALRGTFESNDWTAMWSSMRTSNERHQALIDLSDRKREDQFYAEQTSQMGESVKILKQILTTLEESQCTKEEKVLLEALSSDYKTDKDFIVQRIDGTCEWFFEDDRFLNWRDCQHSNLPWVSAGPGCGKSVLSRALIDERRACINPITSTLCYFFFKDSQERRTKSTNAFAAMLHQVFRDTTLIPHGLSHFKFCGKGLGDNFSEMWDTLVDCTADSDAGEIVCVFDALDECEQQSRRQLINKFFSQPHLNESSTRLKILVTSRPYEDLEVGFQQLSSVCTYVRFDGDDQSERVGQEINLVIDARIEEIAGDFNPEDRQLLCNPLKEKQIRTYLWLFLTFDIIKGSRSKYARMSSINHLLDDLPSEVSDAYEKILSRSSEPALAHILLQIIVVARRPLTLDEVNTALALATDKKSYKSCGELELWPRQSFKSTVKNICGLLLTVRDDRVSLIHQTAREFLTARRSGCHPISGQWRGFVDVGKAHSLMASICFSYLTLEDFAQGYDPLDRISKERYALLQYCARNWVDHHKCRGDSDESAASSLAAARTLCRTDLPYFRWWFPIYDTTGVSADGLGE